MSYERNINSSTGTTAVTINQSNAAGAAQDAYQPTVRVMRLYVIENYIIDNAL
jgi:hypothetical protein